MSWQRVIGPGNWPGGAVLNATTGVAAGPGSIVRTLDGGESWGALLYNSSENGYTTPFGVYFTDVQHGWLVSHGGGLKRTDDGGTTWINVALPLKTGERPT